MGDLGTTSIFYSAKPSVSLENQVDPGLTDGLLNLLVEETTAGLFRCEATFGNWGSVNSGTGYIYFDRRILDFGKILTINSGDGETQAQIFKGYITGIEAHYPKTRPPEIVILAEDRFQDLRMTRRSRSFENISDRDVIQQVASEHGLRSEIDVDGPAYDLLVQVNQSDLAFLRERAVSIDAEIWIEGDTIHAQARSRRNAGRVTLTYGQGLIEFSVLADLAKQRTSLIVSGWDVESKEGIEHEALESAIRGELNTYQSGSSLLQNAFGQRKERLVHLVPHTLQEARFLSESHYRMMARRFLTGFGVAEGDGNIKVGASIELNGLGELFDGEYYICEARHTFDQQNGYRTHFGVERPGL
jgi:phage protein D